MMLVSPMTTDAQIDRLVDAVDGFAGRLESLNS
jgi:glutamate-1-semialdehyde 2,1-aminomutase